MSNQPQFKLIAHSEPMRDILRRIETIFDSDSSVMLIGETGVGKEMVAEYVHRTSVREKQPFVKVGLAALPPDLLESELFGHEKGAFTSASNEKKGLFELANGGSIFLDDIDDFPLNLQSKLLRVLESSEVMRVGGMKPIPIDVRLITAAKIDLRELCNRGMFRSDLYYRINVVPITIPPLRERPDEMPFLVKHFLERFAPDKNLRVSKEAMDRLMHYSWPGNIRELRNIVQRIVLFADTEITLNDLPDEIRGESSIETLLKACTRCFHEDGMTFEQVVGCLEMNLLRQTLRDTDGNRSQAARQLKMSLSTFRDKLKKYNLDGE
jgi:DNA-binding NtrC family response regulator